MEVVDKDVLAKRKRGDDVFDDDSESSDALKKARMSGE